MKNLPQLELCDLGDGRNNIIKAGSLKQERPYGATRAKWVAEMVDADDCEESPDTMRAWASEIVARCNTAPALAAEVERLRKALGFYADKANWHEIRTDHIENNPLECECIPMVVEEHDGGVVPVADCGSIARAALEAK